MIEIKQNCIFIEGKQFDSEFEVSERGGELWFRCDLKDIQKIKIKDYPEILNAHIDLSSDEMGIPLFEIMCLVVRKIKPDIELDFYHYGDYDFLEPIKWSYEAYADAFFEQAQGYEDIRVWMVNSDPNCRHYVFKYKNSKSTTIGACFAEALNVLKVINRTTEIQLSGGMIWRKEYEQDEPLFCTEVLEPLLRKMGFINVRYHHGNKEYGKDFTFSEMTKFRELTHYGLQAKAGNVRGNINSEIDEIIGQIEDAFTMPYYPIGLGTPLYISIFYIAISGKFTQNAKEKIAEKVRSRRPGSIYFLDK
jgi:hypothetical protein